MTYESDQKMEDGVGLAFDFKKVGTVLGEKGYLYILKNGCMG